MKRVAVEGSTCCVVEDLNPRAGRAVVFVHGWPMSKEIFECQYDVLPEYGLRCVGVDLRGFGDSDKPFGGYCYDRMADDLYKVLSALDCRSLTLCGFSMGGAVCVRYMARHRCYKVSKLVLMGAACPSFVQRPGYPYGMPPEQLDGLITQAYNDRPSLCDSFGRMCFSRQPSGPYLEWFRGLCYEAAGHATIKCAEALRDEDLRQDLCRIKVPTAIFHGRRDRVCPFPLAEEMHRGIPCSTLVPFEESGHCLFYEERNKCNSSLIDFING